MSVEDTGDSDIDFLALRKEPERLQKEAEQVGQKLNQLSLSHYTIFIQNHECVDALKTELSGITTSLNSIKSNLNDLADICNSSHSKLDSLSLEMKRNRRTLKCHTQLLDLLEIPQLMDTCLKSSLYDEALSLVNFAHTLLIRHSRYRFDSASTTRIQSMQYIGANKIIDDITNEIFTSGETMKDQLINQLSTEIEIPMCQKIMENLKRLISLLPQTDKKDSIDVDTQLKNIFLQARQKYHLNALKNVNSDSASQYITQYTELKRNYWFDTIKFFEALYSTTLDPLFVTWLFKDIQQYINTLQSRIQTISEGSVLASICDTLMYLGGNLSSVGCDIRPYFVPIITQRIIDITDHTWQTSLLSFHHNLQDPPLWCTPLLNSTIIPTVQYGNSVPEILASYPILAQWVNDMISSFNEIRYCSYLPIQPYLTTKLMNHLTDIINSLCNPGIKISEANPRNLRLKPEVIYKSLCTTTIRIAFGYISYWYHQLFGLKDQTLFRMDKFIAALEEHGYYQYIPQDLKTETVSTTTTTATTTSTVNPTIVTTTTTTTTTTNESMNESNTQDTTTTTVIDNNTTLTSDGLSMSNSLLMEESSTTENSTI